MTALHTPTVPIDLARSWVLVSAAAPGSFDEAAASSADAIILDLEDAVPNNGKAAARRDVVTWLTGRDADGGPSVWVRINDTSTPAWGDDVDALAGVPGLTGVMLAKTESGYQVESTHSRLGGAVPILVLVESAMGMEAVAEIARADGSFRLAFGSGDYRRDTGTGDGRLPMAYPRSRLVVASRAAGLPGPIDGPTLSDDPSELRDDAAHSATMGMTGKLCMKPTNAGPVNAALSPSVDDVHWAHDVIADLGPNGEHVRDGSDRPRLAKAQRIMMRAHAFHIDGA